MAYNGSSPKLTVATYTCALRKKLQFETVEDLCSVSHPKIRMSTGSPTDLSSVPSETSTDTSSCLLPFSCHLKRPPIKKNSGVNPIRKLSTSVLLQDPSLSVYAAAAEKARESHVADVTMRKISRQVGHAFTSTFGWNYHASQHEIVLQSRTLCGKYIRARVKSSTEAGKKCSLQRLRSVTNLSSVMGSTSLPVQSTELKLVSAYLRRMGLELERSHPKLFNSVTSNVGLHKLVNESIVKKLLQSVALELFRNDINWGRIVALFAVTGALATDCVRLGKSEYVLGLIEVFSNIVDLSVANWVAAQGGWKGLQTQFRKSRRSQFFKIVMHLLLPVTIVALFLYMI